MDIKNLSVKFFAKSEIELEAFIPVFHQWIREKSVDGMLLDVADYSHVHQGPGMMLIGHDCDYAIDMAKGKPGLLYRHKREISGELSARLGLVIQRAAKAGGLIEAAGIASFDTSHVEVTFYDRLQAPNTPETYETFKPLIQSGLKPHLGDVTCAAIHSDPRRLFAVHATTSETRTFSDIA